MISLGIIGCAKVVEKHVLKAMPKVKNGKIVSIASRDIKKAEEWASKIKCTYFPNYDSLLKSDVDAVYIPLPIGLHEEWVLRASDQGKHVLCEKSLSGDLASVKRMVDSCKKNKVLLHENFMCNYHPQHEKVLSLLPKIGDSFMFSGMFGFPPLDKADIRYNKELGGGSLNDAGCYTVFMSRKIFQQEPIAVTCKLIGKEIDIKGSAFLEFPDNKFASIGFGFDNLYQNNYSVWTTKGMIKVERAYSIPSDMDPDIRLIEQGSTTQVKVSPADQFALAFEDFFDKIEKKKYDYSGLLEQARTMQALRISSKEDRKVLIKEL